MTFWDFANAHFNDLALLVLILSTLGCYAYLSARA